MGIDNFAWVATWKITHRCNLKCVYCDRREMTEAGAVEDVDHIAIVEKIAPYKPKFLNITGGDPSLLTDLPAVFKRAKELWNPRIRVVHNGTQPYKLLCAFPWLDRLVFSIDGPGTVNALTRGINGKQVFKRIAEVVPEAAKHGVELAFNCVLTTKNYDYIEALTEEIHAISPAISVCFSPVMPPKSDISLLSYPDKYEDFRKRYAQLKVQGHYLLQTFDNLKIHHENFAKIKCYNQYFTLRINPEGKISSCAMNVPVHVNEYAARWKKVFTRDGAKKARDLVEKFLSNRVGNNVDFNCTTICQCENWMDVLFLNHYNESIPIYINGLAERVSEEELMHVANFVKQHINAEFDVELFKERIAFPVQKSAA
ncbi:MAG: radical SAM protein [Chitinivibrionales bacterium]|nr:radical SAM protein [Chitinivibrionales bacterium]